MYVQNFFILEKLLSSGFGVTMLSMYSQYECLSCFCTWCISCLYLSFRSLFPLFFIFCTIYPSSSLVLDVTHGVLGLEDNFLCGICCFPSSLSLVSDSFHILSTDIVFSLFWSVLLSFCISILMVSQLALLYKGMFLGICFILDGVILNSTKTMSWSEMPVWSQFVGKNVPLR